MKQQIFGVEAEGYRHYTFKCIASCSEQAEDILRRFLNKPLLKCDATPFHKCDSHVREIESCRMQVSAQ
jgi:hypothetical protein